MKKNEHGEIQSFLATGIAGSYEFSNPSVSKIRIGKMFPYFDGTEITVDQEGAKMDRDMYIGGRRFHICSIFPMMGEEKKTPTEQLLKYIDSEQGEK